MSSDINKIGIIGAGQMGGGIAHVCALARHDVYLISQTEPTRNCLVNWKLTHEVISSFDLLAASFYLTSTHLCFSQMENQCHG